MYGQHAADRPALVDVIREVRKRWRLKLLLRGGAMALGGSLLVLLAAAYGLELAKFSPAAILGFRILTILALVALVAVFVVRPLLRRVTDEQVALYLEEHEPSLEAAIISAVDATRARAPETPAHESPALVRLLVESAIEKCQAVESGRRVERRPLRQYGTIVGAVTAAGLAAFLVGPDYLRHGLSALLLVSRSVEAASPYRIDVSPGNATVPRGSDQTVTARLVGFVSEQAELMIRKAPGAPFERLPLVPATDAGAFEGLLFDLAGQIDYFVRSAGVRSAVFTLSVVDLPYVQRLELEYRFPAYTGLAPQTVADGGDIAAVRGTEVRLRAVPTIPTPGGRLLLHEAQEIGLAVQPDGALTGRFTVDRDGFYRIELQGPQGEKVAASPQFTIDVLTDQGPAVSFAMPGRDVTASPIEEVFVEARADDDFGVRELQLVYSVNGGPEKTVRLFGGGKPLDEVSAGHTFYLEELGLEPGDFVSYYAKAFDNDQVQGPKSVTSDLYFMQIRPFRKEFRPAPSMAGGGGGGGMAGGQVGALSQQQRQIIAATFNVIRDRKSYTPGKFRENLVFLALAQSRLREQVEGLIGRMNSRLVEPDPAFKKIAEILPKAVEEMRAAEQKLQAQSPSDALPPEQRALQHLQKAEEEYELQVTTGRNAGGGGGGGAGSIAEDLADLFELELDRMANQYEMAERAEQQGADRQLDELMERLRELARRQEQEAERQRRRALAGQSAQGGGASQRSLADEAEEAARRLERLSREQQRADLADAARRLQEAADAMRRAAARGDAQGAAQAAAALDRLREAQRRLQREQSARAERDIQDALRQAEEIAREQGEIASEVQGLGQQANNAPGRQERVRRLSERKDALEGKVGELERQIDRSSAEIRREQREASRKLEEAAGSIRDSKIKEKIRYSKGLIRSGQPEYARAFEDEIGANLDALRRKLGEAAASLGRSKGDAVGEALDKTRDIARGLESLEQRMRDRADQTAGRQQGRGEAQQGEGQRGDAQRGEGQRGEGQQAGGTDAAGRSTEGRGADGAIEGPWGPGGAWGSRRPWRFSPDDWRQFRGEIREWSSEIVELRRRLQEQGIDAADLDEILRALRALDSDRVYKDAAELERLQTFVTEGLKRFEFGLRRRAQAEGEQMFLSGSDEVPQGFRSLVDEYYRSLSRRPQR